MKKLSIECLFQLHLRRLEDLLKTIRQMKLTVIDSIKEAFSAIWIWVVSGSIWGWLMHLYTFTKTWYFKVSAFMISVMIWGFVGYITGEFTSSGALTWVSGAMSMKLFDLFSEHWTILLKTIIERKYWVKLEENEEN